MKKKNQRENQENKISINKRNEGTQQRTEEQPLKRNKSSDFPVVIGITQGDMNSISYEVILKTFADSRMYDVCTPLLYGSTKIASYHKKLLNLPEYPYFGVKDAQMVNATRFNVLNIIQEEAKIDIGVSTALAGELSEKALQMACSDLQEGNIDAIVTGPINKENIQSDTFRFSGHTEFFTKQFGVKDSLMIMCCDKIHIGIVTNHLALKEVPNHITEDLLLRKLNVFHRSLLRDFGIEAPRIAVLALNPHAGDGGINGTEDINVVLPAVQKAQEQGMLVFGPYSADGFFGSGEQVHFDGILALYHDQGLIPFKLMSFDEGVNYTAGLPYVRTSPAHGTAYDIAGKGVASPQSFRNAVYLAADIVNNRRNYDEMHANPLQSVKRHNLQDEDIPQEEEETEDY